MITPVLSSLDHEAILRALGVQSPSDAKQHAGQLDGKLDGQLNCELNRDLNRDINGDFNGDFNGKLNEQIRRCEEQILRVSVPRAVYRVFPSDQLPSELLQGNDIRRLLDGCDETVLLALTLGADLEKCLIREEVTDISNAYVMDVCASAAVEAAADDFENQLREELIKDGRYLTNRFSPGYGDYPLSVQRTLLECVNALRAIGLTLTPTDLMVPRKSITAILGISNKAKPDVLGGCRHCPIREKCSYRAHHKRCWQKDQKRE